MKKSTVIKTCSILAVIVGVLCAYAYLSQKSRDSSSDAAMTAVQIVLSRDLQNNYPPTVKEVIKYYTEIEKCFYDEGCTEEEIEQLGRKARELYDEELLENNEEGRNLAQLKADIAAFHANGQKINSIAIAASTNVDTFTEDGSEFARIYCSYSILEKGKSTYSTMVYLLRRDENRRWKIYGWDLAENVNVSD